MAFSWVKGLRRSCFRDCFSGFSGFRCFSDFRVVGYVSKTKEVLQFLIFQSHVKYENTVRCIIWFEKSTFRGIPSGMHGLAFYWLTVSNVDCSARLLCQCNTVKSVSYRLWWFGPKTFEQNF